MTSSTPEPVHLPPEDAVHGHSLPRTNLHRCLRLTAHDAPTGLRLGLCSLALRYFLPQRDVEHSLRATCLLAERGQRQSHDPGIRNLITGSSVEQLSVPPHCMRPQSGSSAESGLSGAGGSPTEEVTAEPAGGRQIVKTPDVDTMFSDLRLAVSPVWGQGAMFLEDRHSSHSGYVRIRVVPEKAAALFQARQDILTVPCTDENGNTVYYLSSEYYIQALFDYHTDSQRLQGVLERHGPAVNVAVSQGDRLDDSDTVRAIPLTSQHHCILAWARRLRKRGTSWPPTSARVDILKRCRLYVVPTGHPDSPRRDLEWRLSFSLPEKRLAQCLTPEQRKVYLIIKIIQKYLLKTITCLVTYHIKTLMFWQMEATPDAQMWREEHLFARVLNLLDRLHLCLVRHFIPSYFMPQNNLISCSRATDVRELAATVHRIRQHPLQTIYDMDARLRFTFSTIHPLRSYHAPFIRAVKEPHVEGMPAALASSLVHQASDGVPWNYHTLPRCAELLRDAWEVQQPAAAADPTPSFRHWLQLIAALLCLCLQRDEDQWIVDVLEKAARDHDAHTPVITQQHVQLVVSEWSDWSSSPLWVLVQETITQSRGGHTMRRLVDQFVDSERRHTPDQSHLLLMLLDEALKKDTSLHETAARDISPGYIDERDTVDAQTALHKQRLRDDISKFTTYLLERSEVGLDATSDLTSAYLRRQASAGVSYLISDRSNLEGSVLAGRMAGWDEIQAESAQQKAPPATECHLIPSLDRECSTSMAPRQYQTAFAQSTYTPVLDTLGYLVSRGEYLLVVRCSAMLQRFLQRPKPIDSDSTTYDLSQAPRLLSSLPQDIQSLLRLTTCEADLQAVDLFIRGLDMFATSQLPPEGGYTAAAEEFADDWELMMWSLVQPNHPSSVLVTNGMLKLCVLRLLSQCAKECVKCLDDLDCDDVKRKAMAIMSGT